MTVPKYILDEDVVRIFGTTYDSWKREKKKGLIQTLYWGDELYEAPANDSSPPRFIGELIRILNPKELDDETANQVNVKVYHPGLGNFQPGYIKKRKKKGKYLPIQCRGKNLLEVIFVDVQQGDATLIQTPDRKIILIDGGEEKFIARLMAAAFPGTSADNPLIIDTLIITHGDADHFDGLVTLADAQNETAPRKRIFTRLARYYHNGLVKAPGKITQSGRKRDRKEYEMFGDFVEKDGKKFVTSLYNDPREASKEKSNQHFAEWKRALNILAVKSAVQNAPKVAGEKLPRISRLGFGDDHYFDIFRPDVDIRVLGPITDTVDQKVTLAMLRGERGISASHTVNGHSVVLKMTYKNVNFMLGGDLNTHAEERILKAVEEAEELSLRSEILKVPHHGSHEFAPTFLGAVNPVVTVVSSGDENVMKEYVHPRANLMAALGRYSRGPEPLVYSTELAAFFAYLGPVTPEKHRLVENDWVDLPESQLRGTVHAFRRLVFGAVRIRTDGQRVLAAVESASDGVKEAYAFKVDPDGNITQDSFTML